MCSPRANLPCPMGIGHHPWARMSLLIAPATRLAGVATARPSSAAGSAGASDTETQSSTSGLTWTTWSNLTAIPMS
jgi:hypothetical protein